jgi:cytochrome P450
VTTSHYPPGPRDWLPFRLYRAYHRDTLGLLAQLARDYGDAVHVAVCGQHFVLLSHPDQIQDVVVAQHRHFDKANVKIRYVMPHGLSSVVGDVHKQQRHVLQPAFLREHVRGYAPVVLEQSARLAETWKDGQTLDMNAAMMRLTQTIVGKALFDSDVASETEEVRAALEVLLQTNRLLFLPRLRRLPLPAVRRAEAACRHLHALVEKLIVDHRRSERPRNDLLTKLLQIATTEQTLTDEAVRDNVLNLFLAGHETSSTGLTWCWYLLAQYTEVQQRLHAELDEVLAGRPPSVDDVPRLVYTEQVFAEALRLYPPVWALVRTALEPCGVAGYRLPAGTTILMSQYLVHRDPRFYVEPLRFDPEHMTTEARAHRPRFAYFPFGGGPRQCIGEAFAWLEAVLVLATLAQKWRVVPVPETEAVPEPSTTLRPRNGMTLKLKRRRVD